MTTETTYNGWANYETWNVALWIQNDEGLYSLAKEHNDYQSFVDEMASWSEQTGDSKTFLQTGDGVAWNDSGLDHDALNEMIREL